MTVPNESTGEATVPPAEIKSAAENRLSKPNWWVLFVFGPMFFYNTFCKPAKQVPAPFQTIQQRQRQEIVGSWWRFIPESKTAPLGVGTTISIQFQPDNTFRYEVHRKRSATYETSEAIAWTVVEYGMPFVAEMVGSQLGGEVAGKNNQAIGEKLGGFVGGQAGSAMVEQLRQAREKSKRADHMQLSGKWSIEPSYRLLSSSLLMKFQPSEYGIQGANDKNEIRFDLSILYDSLKLTDSEFFRRKP